MMRIHVIAVSIVASLALSPSANATGRLFSRLFPRPHCVEVSPPQPAFDFWRVASPNNVNLVDRGIPVDWSVEEGKSRNIKWSVNPKGWAMGKPVAADGRVFVTTTNPRTTKTPQFFFKYSVIAAYRENDGELLWRIENEYPDKLSRFLQYLGGIASTPVIDGPHLYFTTGIGEVVCAETQTGKVRWRCNLQKTLNVTFLNEDDTWGLPPVAMPLVVENVLYVNTGNRRERFEGKFPSPKAPSFVAFNKHTGEVIWQSNLPGEKIIEGQWSSPVFAHVNNLPQVIFGGGDSVLYSFHHTTGKLLWKCDLLPERHADDTNLQIIGTPVVVGNRLYLGLGVHAEHPRQPRSSYFLCLDITKCGNSALKSYDAKAEAKRGSPLVWAFGGLIAPAPNKGRRAYFGTTISTAVVHDGLVYIPELNGYLHCFDAATGHRYWQYDLRASVWASPLWVDGKIYMATEDDMQIFQHGKTMKRLANLDMVSPLYSTPTVANGVLFVPTRHQLFAIKARRFSAKSHDYFPPRRASGARAERSEGTIPRSAGASRLT